MISKAFRSAIHRLISASRNCEATEMSKSNRILTLTIWQIETENIFYSITKCKSIKFLRKRILITPTLRKQNKIS